MNRIDTRFELLKQNKRMLLAPFVTVGYPNIAISRDLALGYVCLLYTSDAADE